MAVRTSWTAGDVLTAADLTDTFAAKIAYPSGGSDGNVLVKSGTAAAWGTASPHATSAIASVATSQSTTSTTYTDLATAGPAVTVTTGTKALVIVGAELFGASANAAAYMGVAISGATNVSATDATALIAYGDSYVVSVGASRAYLFNDLTAGSNTFTAKYRAGSGTVTFINRQIVVVDMGS